MNHAHSASIDADHPQPASRAQRIVVFLLVVVPLLGCIAAAALLWGRGIGWLEVSLLLAMYLATGVGISVGFHRLFSHRAFETIAPIKLLLSVLGSMAAQGPMLTWVAVHRRHHQHSDKELDPHSPHRYGRGVLAVLAGFWHAHVGWMFEREPAGLARYVRDLSSDRWLRLSSNLFVLWVAIGLALPALIGGLVTHSWFGALLGFLWGGLVRVFIGHHLTWSINSVCHLWGERRFRGRDLSVNNAFFGVLGLGEGWHNNHHAFPASASHGLRWWEIDVGFLFIRTLRLLGLAWRVRVPTPQKIAQRIAEGGPPPAPRAPAAAARPAAPPLVRLTRSITMPS